MQVRAHDTMRATHSEHAAVWGAAARAARGVRAGVCWGAALQRGCLCAAASVRASSEGVCAPRACAACAHGVCVRVCLRVRPLLRVGACGGRVRPLPVWSLTSCVRRVCVCMCDALGTSLLKMRALCVGECVR